MDGIRRNAFIGVQVLLLINWIAPVLCQDGFISIDCGSDVEYVDNATQIRWETDDKYISTGKNEQGITFPIASSYVSDLNKRQVETLRYFDEGRGRDCYVLPVKPQYTYLLRPTFVNENSRNAGPSNFSVYVNSTFWMTIAYSSGTAAQDAPYTYEGLLHSTGTQLNFCLVKIVGTPSIASLELRELSRGMYSTVVGTDSFLSLYVRQNAGAPPDGPSYVRYPDDAYDRVWKAAGPYQGAARALTDVRKTNISTSNALAPNQPPAKVMEDAWISYDDNGSSSIWYYQDFRSLVGPNSLKFQLYSYFQELDGNASASNVRGMIHIFNDEIITPFNVTDDPMQREMTVAISYKRFINVTIEQASWSKLQIMVNAFEMYSVYDFNRSATAFQDVNSLAALQTRFNLTDWTGDPCFPVPYDWLSCTIDPTIPLIARVTELFLGNEPGKMTGAIESVPPEITNLTALTYLNLSSNRLTALPANLKELNLAVLDCSKNLLSGNIGNFLEAINLSALREIHAADNHLDGEFQIDSLVQIKNVKVGYFDRNLNINGLLNLSGWHASLLTAIQGGSPELQLFSLVGNKITDIYPQLDVLESTIEAVLRLENGVGLLNGILLGGNPYCEDAKSRSTAQRYLCRFSIGTNDTLFQATHAKSSRTFIATVIGTSVGAFLLLAFCICFPILWKLRKQTYALLEIQEALTKQQVQPPFYSYAELKAATGDFSPNNKLGEGAFGAVYKAVGVDRSVVAVKKLKLTNQVMTEFLNEVVLITGIKHRNLVQLKGCCILEKERILVYEYAENGSLADALWGISEQGLRLDWKKRFDICVGVARGLAYLHEELQPRIIHRDIKSANILIDKNFNAKIGDFGLARRFLDDQSQANFSHRAGTLGYFAPEYASQGHLTEKADVFSFGVLLLEIVSGRRCIDHKLSCEKVYLLDLVKEMSNEGRLMDLLEAAIQESSSNMDGEVMRVINVALLCVQNEPSRRPTMSHVVTMLQGSMDVTVFLDIPVFRSLSINAHTKFNFSLGKETLIGPSSLLSQSGNVNNIPNSRNCHCPNGSLEITSLSAR